MFRSIAIKNFRGFESLTIPDLARINLIAGMNNTGKTSVLEALYVHLNSNNCHLVLNLLARGAHEATFSGVMQWIFHDRNSRPPSIIESIDDSALESSTEFWITEGKDEELYQKIKDIDKSKVHDLGWPNNAMIAAIIHQETPPTNHISRPLRSVATMILHEKSRSWSNAGTQKFKNQFLQSKSWSEQEDLENYSRLNTDNRIDEVVSVMSLMEPRLKRLSLSVVGGQTMIHADIGLGRLVPIFLVGEGMRRLLSIVLAIFNCPNGVVLIDEIENGLHHSVMEIVWKAITQAARQADVQIFATTHSYECIQAAHAAFAEGTDDDLRLHRLDRIDRCVEAVTYTHDNIETALDMNMEVR